MRATWDPSGPTLTLYFIAPLDTRYVPPAGQITAAYGTDVYKSTGVTTVRKHQVHAPMVKFSVGLPAYECSYSASVPPILTGLNGAQVGAWTHFPIDH